MRRSWFAVAVITYMTVLAGVVAQQGQPAPAPRTLSQENRAALEKVYQQVRAATVRITTVPQGLGSGFFISDSGLVMTAFHVISDTRSFRVVTTDQNSYPAELVGYDEFRDLAILKADVPGKVPFLQLDISNGPRPADPLLAVGNSRGQFIAPRYGVVNNVERDIFPFFNSIAISTTIPLAPGDSGGPVVNRDGKAVAVVVAIGNIQGEFESFLSPLLNQGRTIQQLSDGFRRDVPYIGVQLQRIDEEVAGQLGIPREGVIVSVAFPTGAAARAGLRSASVSEQNGRLVVNNLDVILAADGRRFNEVEELQRYVRSKQVGDTVTLTVRRGSETFEVRVTLTPNPSRQS